jgi:hypothetical protein
VRGKIVTTAAALVLALTLAACGTPTKPSGVYGIVLFSGGPSNYTTSPLPDGLGSAPGRITTVDGLHVWTLKDDRPEKLVAKAQFGPYTTFRLTLPPGRYLLRAVVPKDGPEPLTAYVTVKPGRYSRVIVYVEGM